MSEEGNKVVLRGDFIWIYDKQERFLMKFKRSPDSLYKFVIESSK